MKMPQIQAVGTAVPEYIFTEEEIKQTVRELFGEHYQQLEQLLAVFDHSLIRTRHFSKPLSWYQQVRTFAETNKIFEETALVLAEKAARQAMAKAKVQSEDIGLILFVSSTGISTPSLDARLIQRLGLSLHTTRIPIWGLGCAGGVSALARGADLAYSIPEKSVLLITVELCSLTFQRQDYSKANLVGSCLFADGAAAALIKLDSEGPAIIDHYSTIIPDSFDVMGWDVVDTGFKVRFSRDIPSIITGYLPGLMTEALEEWGINQEEICHYIVHPGGAKVLRAYQESLKITEEKLVCAYEVLAQYGNMSSSSVLFVLEKFLKARPPEDGYGVMLALGPGFSAEKVLFKW